MIEQFRLIECASPQHETSAILLFRKLERLELGICTVKVVGGCNGSLLCRSVTAHTLDALMRKSVNAAIHETAAHG